MIVPLRIFTPPPTRARPRAAAQGARPQSASKSIRTNCPAQAATSGSISAWASALGLGKVTRDHGADDHAVPEMALGGESHHAALLAPHDDASFGKEGREKFRPLHAGGGPIECRQGREVGLVGERRQRQVACERLRDALMLQDFTISFESHALIERKAVLRGDQPPFLRGNPCHGRFHHAPAEPRAAPGGIDDNHADGRHLPHRRHKGRRQHGLAIEDHHALRKRQ